MRSPKEKSPDGSKKRWRTVENVYIFVTVSVFFCYILYKGYQRSDAMNSGIGPQFGGLRQGWIPGRKIDLSDGQYREWRSNFPLLIVGMVVFTLLSTAVKRTFQSYFATLTFYVVTSFGFLAYLHGASAFWVIMAASVNYLITRVASALRSNPSTARLARLLPLATWAWNLGVLFTSYLYQGYTFAVFGENFRFLDSYRGFVRWDVYFKISMLRCISFAIDCHTASTRSTDDDKLAKQKLVGRAEYYVRQETDLPLHEYNFFNYFAYVFYLPLYIAGPVITFNAFVSQVRSPQKSHTLKQILVMFARVLLYSLCFEVIIHYYYYYGLNENNFWLEFQPWEVGMCGFFTLNYMYTKFLIIWRFFRVWSLLDGIDTPENMNRCVNNNCTFTGFWRSWHASLNQWIIRYMYKPLGGTKWQAVTIWPIFTFIGLWHDLWWRWVAWAWLNCAFFSVEIVVMTFFLAPKRSKIPGQPNGPSRYDKLIKVPGFRQLVALCGTFNIFLLMAANLAILHGFEGTYLFFHKLFLQEGGLQLFVVTVAIFSSGVLMMMRIREKEASSGTKKRF